MAVNILHFHERACCPVCDTAGAPIFFAAPMTEGAVRDFLVSHYAEQGEIDWSLLDGTDFALAECEICRLIYQVAEPKDGTLEAIYMRMIHPDFLDPYEQSLLTLDNFGAVAGEMALLFARTGKAPGDIRFLDYGFGYGRWARVARALGATVYATEIGEDKARAAAELGVRLISDEEVDAMRFDIVHAEQVFEHLTRPRETFRRLARVTDGLFKVAVPRGGRIAPLLKAKGMTAQSPFARAGALSAEDRAYLAVQPLEHLNAFAPATMEWLARDADMRIISRTREAMVMLDMGSPRGIGRAGVAVAKEALRRVLKPNTGYYLFAPNRPAG